MKKGILTVMIIFAILTTIAQTKLSVKLHSIQAVELPVLLDNIKLDNASSNFLKVQSTSKYIIKTIIQRSIHALSTPLPSITTTTSTTRQGVSAASFSAAAPPIIPSNLEHRSIDQRKTQSGHRVI